MDIIGFVIIIILGLILYMIMNMESDNIKEPLLGGRKDGIKGDYRGHFDMRSNYSVESSNNSLCTQINSNLINNQFHNDYRDVINGINNLVPEQKQLFNLANIPLKYSEPNTSEVRKIVDDFIYVLNTNVKNDVDCVRNANTGWNEPVVEPKVKSGWDKIQESLGLNPSLWNEPKNKSKIILKQIKYVQKYETEDEIKYNITLIIQKLGVKDQMYIQPSFVIDKRPLQNENNFFVNKRVGIKMAIENIFILGYLSNDGIDSKLLSVKDVDKYYNYNDMECNNMTNPKLVQDVLMKKYAQRTNEMELRNAALDEEGQAFHKTLPNMYNYTNIQDTRTIFDDMNTDRVFI